jgi:hypothetical protein
MVHITFITSLAQFDDLVNDFFFLPRPREGVTSQQILPGSPTVVALFYTSSRNFSKRIKPVFLEVATSPEFESFIFCLVDQDKQDVRP